MKIQTFSIVAGSAACNAACPYCVSKMTGKELGLKEPKINWRNFEKACRLSQVNNVSTVLITGKGEPTLYPEQITEFLKHMKRFEFPLVELQTNGLVFNNIKKYEKYLKEWYSLGLNTICFSIAHYNKKKNKEIFTPKSSYIDLGKVIEKLHSLGYSIRLSCIMMKGFIDSVEEVSKLAEFSKKLKVEQLTIRSVKVPGMSEDKKVYGWAKEHEITKEKIEEISRYLEKNAKKLMTLEHGAVIYDLAGQNICLSDCLTIKPESENLRQLIFFPDGHLRYDWQYKGAILM